MHIPRQTDGSRERAARRTGHEGSGATAVPGPAALGADGLRARLERLVAQQRAVTYWQRLVQARTDLVVAGLLYGTPVPAARTLAATTLGGADQARPATPPCAQDPDDLHALATPPDGLDVAGLLGVVSLDGDGPGGHLDRLRVAAGLLAHRRCVLEAELDAVTLALQDRLAGTSG
ncbi:hypothetical protein [Aquipuribacter sp. MA13-6]|uniref:hypothetical protein n=1 Tax=unclassified Aquipuribacter TaxID=2635084 RepID=UPI003EEAC52B